MNNETQNVLSFLKTEYGFDFCGYQLSVVEMGLKDRMSATKCVDWNEYKSCLEDIPNEIDCLIDAITVGVSHFFRETLTFEYFSDRILPVVAHNKQEASDHSLRVWSAGCSTGEEPYSVAILINELLKMKKTKTDLCLVASDIDKSALKKAKDAVYSFESIKGVKYDLIKKYFKIGENSYTLISEIKEMVSFCAYDLLDPKTSAPPESVFGSFDLVFCRNVLIYYNAEYQTIIFDKLYKSLAKDGYLVLGEVEMPPAEFGHKFRQETKFCKIFRKM